MLDRIIRAIRLDRTLYREVADNPSYFNEAVIIVVVAALLSALGTLFVPESGGPVAYLLQVINSLLLGWVLWAAVAYFVGTRFFGGRSSVNEMLRVLGYANAPRLIGFFGFIPCVGWIFAVVGWLLSMAAGVIAIRESMEFDTGKAVITAVVGFLFYIIAAIIIGALLGGLFAPIRSIVS